MEPRRTFVVTKLGVCVCVGAITHKNKTIYPRVEPQREECRKETRNERKRERKKVRKMKAGRKERKERRKTAMTDAGGRLARG